MKKTTKTRDLILSLLLAAAVCALLGWYQADTSAHSYAISIIERSAIYAVVAVAMNLWAVCLPPLPPPLSAFRFCG